MVLWQKILQQKELQTSDDPIIRELYERAEEIKAGIEAAAKQELKQYQQA